MAGALLMAAGMCFTSCSKDEMDAPANDALQMGPARTLRITASIATQNTDKAAAIIGGIGDTYGKVYWEVNDQFLINGATASVDSIWQSDSTTARFTATASAILQNNQNIYRGLYPASIARSMNRTNLEITLPATYTPTDGITRMSGNYMAAYVNLGSNDYTPSLSFKNLCAILKIKVQAVSGATGVDTKVKKIRLASASGLSGDYEVRFSNGVPTLYTATPTPGNIVELDFSSDPVDITTEKEFAVMIPAVNQEGFIMQIWNGDGSKCIQKEKASARIDRSYIYDISVKETFQNWGGAISVSDNQRVWFAGGNLQHNFAQNKWRFAHEQYSLIEDSYREQLLFNFTTDPDKTYAKCEAKYAQIRNLDIWSDLFAWGTSGDNRSGALNYAPYCVLWGYDGRVPNGTGTMEQGWGNRQYGWGYGPVGADYGVRNFSNLGESYLGYYWDWTNCDPTTHIPAATANQACHSLFADWGFVHNAELNATISDPTKRAGVNVGETWRTLSAAEYNYVYCGTKRLEIDGTHKCGLGRIDTTGNGDYANGLFLLPDNMHWFLMPPDGLQLKTGPQTHFYDNTYTYAQFKRLESYGVVFLPACGARTNTIHHTNEIGFYWTSTSNGTNMAADNYTVTPHQHAYSFKIYGLNDNQNHLSGYYTENKFDGNAVRLVRNTDD